jgi:hypothetical protein
MNKQEYNEEIKRIEKQRKDLIIEAKRTRAGQIKKDVDIKTGNKISDKSDSIEITSFNYGYKYRGYGDDDELYLIANGFALTKKGEPRKDKTKAKIYIQTTDDFQVIK